MTHDDFRKILGARIEKMLAVLETKAGEYATVKDRLHNFKRAAKVTGETPAQACVGFMTKHLVSLLDIVDAQATGARPTAPILDEKIGDTVNYLVLLEAILLEGN